MFKKALFIIFIVILSGLSGIIANKYLFPRLAATKLFSKYEFLKKSAEDVTIINKTEQVYVREDSSISKIASQVTSSVVNIVSYPKTESKNRTLLKNGTGVITTSDGIIMTYASAINIENSSYKILAADGNVYEGELLGVDSWSNLAFIKINAGNLPVITFGNSDEYKAGEKIVAIGNNQLDYQNQLVSGILSRFDATYNISGYALEVPEKISGVFLTDLNPQSLSSGDPVIDYSGRAVGITGSTLRNGQTEYFIIPANKIEAVISKVIKKELGTNPSLGIYYLSLSRSYALANNSDVDKGALIFSPSGQAGLAVIFGTPAAKAGLKLGDIIAQVNGEEINQNNNLSSLLYKYKKGGKVEFAILRDGKEIKIPVQL